MYSIEQAQPSHLYNLLRTDVVRIFELGAWEHVFMSGRNIESEKQNKILESFQYFDSECCQSEYGNKMYLYMQEFFDV